MQARLRQRAHRSAPSAKSAKATAAETLNSGARCTRTQASVITPRIPSEPISIRSGRGPGARAGQPPALPGPPRRDRPHRLHEVVDVGLQGGEVAAGAGRDPAAERRVLERLREVAQRQPVLAQLVLERRPGGAGLDPRRPRDRVDLEHAVQRRRSRVTTGRSPSRGSTPPTDAGAAPERDHRRAGLAQLEHRSTSASSREGDDVRRVVERPRRSRGRRPDRPSPASAKPARKARRRTGPRTRQAASTGSPQLHLLQRHRLLDLAPEPKSSPNPFPSFPQLCSRRSSSSYPHPQCLRRRSLMR